MQDIDTYKEYEDLFKDDLVKLIRKILNKTVDFKLERFRDSNEHNSLIEYFNKFGLHKKLTKAEFTTWK